MPNNTDLEWTTRDEGEVIGAALKGDIAAFRSIVERYQGMVLGLCFNLLGDRADAEDAAQDTFVLFYRNLRRYREGGKIINWLYTIALNVSRKILRRRRIVRFFSMDSGKSREGEANVPQYGSGAPSVERVAEGKEEALLLGKLVAGLPADLKIPIILRYYQGLEEKEIAPMLDISPGNLRVRLHRGRMKLWNEFNAAIGGAVTPDGPGDRTVRRKDAHVPD